MFNLEFDSIITTPQRYTEIFDLGMTENPEFMTESLKFCHWRHFW
jgi:hypothetical protein